MTDFRDLIDTDDLSLDEEERLRRTHELLLKVGPPAELPPALLRPERAPTRHEAQIVQFPLRPRRRAAPRRAPARRRAGGGRVRRRVPVRAREVTSGAFASAQLVPMHAVAGGQDVSAVGSSRSATRLRRQLAAPGAVSGLPKQPARRLLRALADEERQAVPVRAAPSGPGQARRPSGSPSRTR